MVDETKAAAPPAKAAKAPDDNKRLAALEAGASALAVAVATAVGVDVGTITEPFAAATGALETMKAQIAELEAQLYSMAGYASATIGRLVPDLNLAPQTGEAPFAYLERLTVAAEPRIAALIAGPDGATEGEIAAIARAEKAEADLKVQTDRATAAEAALDEANQKLADAGDVVEPDDPAIERTADNARPCGPDLPLVDREDLASMMEEGQRFELAFGDGTREIVGFNPTFLDPSKFRRLSNGRYLVTSPIMVKGGIGDEHIHGAGLFVNGEEVAYCPLERQLTVKSGDQRQFSGQLSF